MRLVFKLFFFVVEFLTFVLKLVDIGDFELVIANGLLNGVKAISVPLHRAKLYVLMISLDNDVERIARVNFGVICS